MSEQLALVPFQGTTLPTLKIDGLVSVAMRPVVEALGLVWGGQYNRLRRHPVLSTCVFVMNTQLPGSRQGRDQVFLPIAYLNGWLFGIDTRRVKPELRDILIAYQRECFLALDAYWRRGWSRNPRLRRIADDEQPHDSLGKRQGERFAEERRKFEEREGIKLLGWMSGTSLMSKASLRAIEEMDSRIDDKLFRFLIGLGFDMNYVLYGKRVLTQAERGVRDVMRMSDPEARAELIAHAETIHVELIEKQDGWGEAAYLADRQGKLVDGSAVRLAH